MALDNVGTEMEALPDVAEFLERERIVSVTLTHDCRFIALQEQCDSYFEVKLTRTELVRWIEQLCALRDRMVEG